MTLENIGQKLKAAREGQGLSLAQIYERTKIPINHLEAIDCGQPEHLPEAVYVAGFIKRYADCVGLNGHVLAEEYRKETDELKGNGDSHWAKATSAQPIYVTPAYLNRTKIEQPQPNPLKWMAFYGFWAVLMVGLVIVLFNWVQNTNTTQQDPAVLALRQSTAKFNAIQPHIEPLAQTAPSQPVQQAAGDKDSRIALSANQHVWVEVKALSSGDSLFTGYMEAGDRRDFQDAQGLRVRAGNGGSLSVDFQGKNKTFGPTGKVTEQIFVAKNAAIAKSENQETKTVSDANAKSPAIKKTRHNTGVEAAQFRAARRRSDAAVRPSPEASGSHSIDVPYRYTEGHSEPE